MVAILVQSTVKLGHVIGDQEHARVNQDTQACSVFKVNIMKIKLCFCSSFIIEYKMHQGTKLGFYVPFNSQGHIGTGPQNCHLWDSNPQR